MPHLLHDLRINRVALVDRGAGRGVHVKLWKRDAVEQFLGDQGRGLMRKLTDAAVNELIGKHLEGITKGLVVLAKADGGGLLADEGKFAALVKRVTENVSKAIVALDEALGGNADAAVLKQNLDDFVAHVGKLGLGDVAKQLAAAVEAVHKGDDSAMTPEQIAKMIADAVAKAVSPLQTTIDKQALDLAVAKLSPLHKQYYDESQAGWDEPTRKAFAFGDDKAKDDKMKKDPAKKGLAALGPDIAAILEPLVKGFEALTAGQADIRKRVGEVDDVAKREDFAKRALALGLPREHGEVMRKAFGGDVEAMAKHEAAIAQQLKAAHAQGASGMLFAEFGKAAEGGAGATPYQQLTAKALELQKSELAAGRRISKEQAFSKVYTDVDNKDLVAAHKREETAKRMPRAA